MTESYHITVGGERLKTVKIGKIERGSGQTILSEERGETLAKRGNYMFPNKCQVWAARVIDGKMPENGEPPISITNPKYTGELKGLKWGAKGGSIIEARYLRGYPTLDVLYQEKVLNFRVNEEDESSADAFFLMFPNGDNDFDENADPYLIQHLKWHAYNNNSISKNPTFYTTSFFEKTFDQQERLDTQTWDEEFEAMKIVREAGDGTDGVARCKNLLSIVKSVTDEEPDDNKVYAYLKMISQKRAPQFLEAVKEYKRKVSDVFSKMDSYEIADYTVDGTLVVEDTVGKGKSANKVQKIVLSDLPVKGKAIYEYMLENFTEPKIFEATNDLIQITDKIK